MVVDQVDNDDHISKVGVTPVLVVGRPLDVFPHLAFSSRSTSVRSFRLDEGKNGREERRILFDFVLSPSCQ